MSSLSSQDNTAVRAIMTLSDGNNENTDSNRQYKTVPLLLLGSNLGFDR